MRKRAGKMVLVFWRLERTSLCKSSNLTNFSTLSDERSLVSLENSFPSHDMLPTSVCSGEAHVGLAHVSVVCRGSWPKRACLLL